MKKALVMASVASMIDLFNMENIKILRSRGFEVHVACNFESGSITSQARVDEFRDELENAGIKTYHIPVPRKTSSIKDIIRSYRLVKEMCKKNKYLIVHCHSPIGGVITRFACKDERRFGTKVIYTAHGFHFFKGAPLKNWMLYYPLERWCARFTDVLITINREDYDRAKKSFRAKKVEYIHGIGIDTMKFGNTVIDKKLKHRQLGIPEDAFVLLSVGELNKNKNHAILIRALAKLNNTNIHYFIVGHGDLQSYLIELANSLGVAQTVHILGYRNDVGEFCKMADIFCFPSFREGLSVALMESMAASLPVVCSNIRGNNDLIENVKGGFLVKPDDADGFALAIEKMMNDKALRYQQGLNNLEFIKYFDIAAVSTEMETIYGGQNHL